MMTHEEQFKLMMRAYGAEQLLLLQCEFKGMETAVMVMAIPVEEEFGEGAYFIAPAAVLLPDDKAVMNEITFKGRRIQWFGAGVDNVPDDLEPVNLCDVDAVTL